MGNCCSSPEIDARSDIHKNDKPDWSVSQEQSVEKSAFSPDIINKPPPTVLNKIQESPYEAPESHTIQQPVWQSNSSSIAEVLPPIVPINFTPMDTSIMGMMNMKSTNIETIHEAPRRVLYIILPYANPLGFKRRKELLLQTVDKLTLLADKLAEDDTCNDKIEIVVSQIVYAGQIGLSFNKNDLLFHTDKTNILWSKENLINLAVQDILAKTKEAEYFAFVDADIVFDNQGMITKTIDLLEANQRQMVQMFSHAVLNGPTGEMEYVVKSFGYQYHLKKSEGYKAVVNTDEEYWHPGFAWAMHRATFRAVGGLIDRTLGSADRHMAMGLLNRAIESVPPELQSSEYGRMVLDWQSNAQYAKIKLSHVDGKVYHHWHGELKNRKYVERWEILIKNDFQPRRDMRANDLGLIVWSEHAQPSLLKEICEYFKERNDDQDPQEAIESRKRSSTASKDSNAAKGVKLPPAPKGIEGEIDGADADGGGDDGPEAGGGDSADNDAGANIGDPEPSVALSEYVYEEVTMSGNRKQSVATIFKGKGTVRNQPPASINIVPIEEEKPHTLSAVDLLTAKSKNPVSSTSIEQISVGSGSSSSSEFQPSVHETPKGPFTLPFHRDSSSLGNDLLGMPEMAPMNGNMHGVAVAVAHSNLIHSAVHQSSASSMDSAQAATITTEKSSNYGTVIAEEQAQAAFQSSLLPVYESEIPGLSSFYAGGA